MADYTNAEVGAMGEAIAVRWLTENGFEIMATNWRSGRYELDIVARKRAGGDIVHFVEVKTRRAGNITTAEDAITPAKFRALQHAAAAFLSANAPDGEAQFDVVTVQYEGSRCTARYIPNAMVMKWRTY